MISVTLNVIFAKKWNITQVFIAIQKSNSQGHLGLYFLITLLEQKM